MPPRSPSVAALLQSSGHVRLGHGQDGHLGAAASAISEDVDRIATLVLPSDATAAFRHIDLDVDTVEGAADHDVWVRVPGVAPHESPAHVET